MANKKITELSQVTTLPDEAVFTAVDSTRASGDQNVKITKSDLANDIGGGGGGLPAGGSQNDELIKQSGTDGDADWYRKRYFNVKLYGVKGDGVDLVDGNITASSSTFTSASATFTPNDVGKVIIIEGANTINAYLITTIASFTSANEVELTDGAVTTVSNATFRYGTDDTSAIQALINSFDVDVSFVLYFPIGIYIINGDLQNGINDAQGFPVDYNSQIYFPNSQNLLTRRTIAIIGEVAPNFGQGAGIGTFTTPTTGVILHSTKFGSGDYPSIFAQGVTTDPVRVAQPDYRPFDYNNIVMKNLCMQWTPDSISSARIGAVNSFVGKTVQMEDLTHFPFNLNLVNSSQPQIDITGFVSPQENSEHINQYNRVLVGGMTTGLLLGEHTLAINFDSIACLNGFGVGYNSQYVELIRCLSKWCKFDITEQGNILGNAGAYILGSINMEWDVKGSWYDYEASVNDLNNRIRGTIFLNAVLANVGNESIKEFKRYGGHNLEVKFVSGGLSFPTSKSFGLIDSFARFDYYDNFTDSELNLKRWETLQYGDATISLDAANNQVNFNLPHTGVIVEGNEIQNCLISRNFATTGEITMNFTVEFQNATRDTGLVHCCLWDEGTTQSNNDFNVARIFSHSVAGQVSVQIWQNGSNQYSLTGITPTTERFKIEYSFYTNEIKFFNWDGASWLQLGTTQTYNIHNKSGILKSVFAVNDSPTTTGIDFAYLKEISLSEKQYTSELPF